ncbi:MAG TPA: D-2-hydroxyacid dehydrogenase family protein [Nocardioidaceae bacterium]|nr:D-2-hydroxyacid dehydrogenase family protein [Nocardioidaceae bacterium]
MAEQGAQQGQAPQGAEPELAAQQGRPSTRPEIQAMSAAVSAGDWPGRVTAVACRTCGSRRPVKASGVGWVSFYREGFLGDLPVQRRPASEMEGSGVRPAKGSGMRIAVLDDYQGVALEMADWSPVLARAEVDVFTDHVRDVDALAERLAPHDVVVVMRERTPVPEALLERLPNLRLIVSTGRRNAAVDVAAARARGIEVCGTPSLATAPAELTWALVLGLARHLPAEAAGVRAGGWQTTVGRDLHGRTLGILGLGRIGTQVAQVGVAFGMDVVAWSANLTDERAAEAGARRVDLDTLLAGSDVVTLHLVLGERTQGLLGRRELALMKPDALLVNTARAGLVDTHALVDALAAGRLGGAGLDVFDEEPLPVDHPLRGEPRALLTPHLGYVTEDVYRTFFAGVVEDILAFWGGTPLRPL